MSQDLQPGNIGSYPEDNDLKKFIDNRKRGGLLWRLSFQLATLIAILALLALLYNIFNGAFGYVALQNKVDPNALVLAMEEDQMLSSPKTVSSEDDNELVKRIENNPNAIGFFGYAYYNDNTDKLKLVSVEGQTPSRETAESGEYPLARPLFIYSAADVMQENRAIGAFIDYYLTNVNTVIEDVGYFPISDELLNGATTSWSEAVGDQAEALQSYAANPADVSDHDIRISGSSTVYPLTRQMAIQFRRAGFQGGLDLQQTGTTAGFRAFCEDMTADITNASRPITRAESEACGDKKRTPVEFRVGTDALAIAVSSKNTFLENVTKDELRQIFTTAETWSDVNPAWPNEPIERFIPGADSGTLDFFAETVFNRKLPELTESELVKILEANISTGLMRRYEAEKPLAERSQAELVDLVLERVVEQKVVGSWKFTESLFNRTKIEEEVARIPQGELQWRSWISPKFLITPQSSTPELAGVRTALFGTLWVIAITILVALPIGVGAAIYLEEYAVMVANPILRRVNAIIQTNINNLAGVPSIIYGILGLAIFVRAIEPITSGTLFGISDPTTANGRTIISASFTLALLILPLIIINAQEAIRAVPNSLRQAGMGLGATRWQTIWSHVLPNAIPGILTGNILAMSRAIGETAPLVVIGASTFITVDPTSPFSKFTVLPIQIYQWVSRPQPEFRNIAAAAIIVLLILLLTLNASAVILRNRYSRRLS
ncbi:MAG: phosphate ABC transporter permease PstA [Anaerolineaceae bacterium]|nr:phosphate ABC transporter permease PstA [Anaerolineaceae bacterium]MCB9101784.1 phosphate ABC transporter permease PstA [Anaerolineales bacterium]